MFFAHIGRPTRNTSGLKIGVLGGLVGLQVGWMVAMEKKVPD